MSINIRPKTDYSALFSSISGKQSNTFSLADYASIKNGSYFKVMKAYYGKDNQGIGSTDKFSVNKGASTDTAKTNANVESKAEALSKAADALLKTGSDSLFAKKDITSKDADGNETTTYDYDRDAIYKAVDAFAGSYNSMIDAAIKSRNEGVVGKATDMVTQSLRSESLLNKVGITIGEDNKLSVDETKLKSADISTLKSLFNGVGSYAYGVQSKASYMNMYAKEDAGKASGIYSSAAQYQANLDTGSILNSFM